MRLTPPESDSSSLNSMELERDRGRHDDSDTGSKRAITFCLSHCTMSCSHRNSKCCSQKQC
ncbi:unnamed protein product [Cyprideis torosa]|uniref:Uncharacterized protein n=1 Tax=Cyprideis torosa TaxID=163714 RepID=A0A7R8WBW4_9CRUS|nr:unnamed protein product [Cyprideis torosa]CAG0892722.1 unnamed protein product [Cyprideis torosa]